MSKEFCRCFACGIYLRPGKLLWVQFDENSGISGLTKESVKQSFGTFDLGAFKIFNGEQTAGDLNYSARV
ncbi:MAG: hypothetical protein R2788_03355 [Saprospiraceae bacterium]